MVARAGLYVGDESRFDRQVVGMCVRREWRRHELARRAREDRRVRVVDVERHIAVAENGHADARDVEEPLQAHRRLLALELRLLARARVLEYRELHPFHAVNLRHRYARPGRRAVSAEEAALSVSAAAARDLGEATSYGGAARPAENDGERLVARHDAAFGSDHRDAEQRRFEERGEAGLVEALLGDVDAEPARADRPPLVVGDESRGVAEDPP